jgi:hypothetical protein
VVPLAARKNLADRQRLADRLLWRLSLLINPLVTESRLYHSTPCVIQRFPKIASKDICRIIRASVLAMLSLAWIADQLKSAIHVSSCGIYPARLTGRRKIT